LLDGQPDIVVVGEAGSGEEAAQLARETRPDVVLMGRSVPGLDGLSALREIRADADLGQVKVLVLTGSADDDVFSAVRGGASGVLLNDAEPAELVGAVRVVGRGGALLSPAIAQRLIDEIHRALPEQQPPCPDKFAELTMREREVLALAAQGLTNQEIAQRLLVSAATAKSHVSRTMIKLGIHDRAKLVAFAYQTGFVQPRPPPSRPASLVSPI
jgi:DNA-binding NarL/FixJ family response regulator